MHESLDEFEFRQDSMSDYRVSCPWFLKKMYNVVNTLTPSFLIESSSFLQVTRTTIRFGLSSKLSLIGPCTAELAVLVRLKNPHRLTMGEML